MVLLIGLALISATSAQAIAPMATSNTADIVVQFGNGEVVVKRVSFTGTISGLEALRLTGLDLVEENGAVCRIGDTGCGAEQECFCACPPPFTTCLYWSYERWNGTAWVVSNTGAANTTVTNGAVEGWTWGRKLPHVTPALLSANAGLEWLRPQQALDGTYANGNISLTLDTLLANRALAGDASRFAREGGVSLLQAIEPKAASYAAQSAASAGKLAVSVAAADRDPRSFGGINLVISMTATLDQGSGAYGTTNWDQSFSILGLRAAGESVPQSAIDLLKSRANSDGSWAFFPTDPGDVDTTGLVLQALIAAGVPTTDPVITKALDYLDSAQNDDGGFPYEPQSNGSDISNVNSTAFAIQGLIAAGSDPLIARWQPTATNPISYLLTMQQPDGAFTFGGSASLLATQQAIPALVGQTFPFHSRAVAKRLALGYIADQQQPDGSFAGFGVGSTIDAILAIKAAGGDPRTLLSSSGNDPLDYLATQAASYAASSAAAAGKLMVGVVAAGEDPRSFAGVNLVISTTLRYDATTGAYGSSTYDQAWAILGLKAAGESVPIIATDRLQAMASTGGGWGFSANDPAPDADSTGLALMALAAAGVGETDSSSSTTGMSLCSTGAGSSNPSVLAAISFLRSKLKSDGGFPGFDGNTSASSTGLGLQGLAAYHDTPRGLSWSTTGASISSLTLANPVDTLLDLQTASGGFPGFSGPNDPDSTYQSLPGLLGASFPTNVRSVVQLPLVVSP
jgi:hypothetical protein